MPLFWKKPTSGKDGASSSGFMYGSQTSQSPGRDLQSGIALANGGLAASQPTQKTPERRTKQSRDLQNFESAPYTLRRRSRLSPDLVEVLRDGEACQYFLHFLETRDSAHMFQFWLDAESFQASTKARMSSHSRQNSLKLHTAHRQRPPPAIGHDDGGGSGGKASSEQVAAEVSMPGNGGDPGAVVSAVSTTIDDTSSSAIAGDESVASGTKVPTSAKANAERLRGLGTDYLSLGHERTLSDVRAPCVAPEASDRPDLNDPKSQVSDSPEALSKSPVPNSDEQIILKLHKCIEENAVKIFTKYIAKDATHPIGISDELRNGVTGMICSESGNVNPMCFAATQNFVAEVLESEYFNDFLQSEYYCRHQIDVLTNGTVALDDILYNEISLAFFIEFMEQEGQREMLDFWLTADHFYRHLVEQNENYNSMQAQEDAMVIYDKYFSLQATSPLGFNDAIRFEMEQNICREGGPLPSCFDSAIKVVLGVLQQVYLLQFLGSQLYVKYLTELVNMVKMGHDQADRKKWSGSDTSSEHSLHTLNTLLAMDGTQPGVPARRYVKRFEDDEMRIDTGLFVPDALWQRPLAGKLRIGYVDGMGRFITEFEPEPDRKRHGESRFSKVVKKLVSQDDDKTKEELALQVAKMIIHEVTSVTLGAVPLRT